MVRMHDDEGRFIYGWTMDLAPIVDVDEFERAMVDRESRRLARDEVLGYVVSTAHTVTDYSWWPGPEAAHPVVFETAVFAHGEPISAWRHATKEHALDMHQGVVTALLAGTDPWEISGGVFAPLRGRRTR